MSSPAALLPKFFVVSGVILILSGVAQAFVRPRKPGESLAEKLVNRAVITAILSLAIGIAGILVGVGVLPMPRF